MDIETFKQRDNLLIKETGVKAIARLVGYTEIGEPIELVFNSSDSTYNWQIAGEFVAEASQQSVVQFLPFVCTIGAL